MNKNFNFKKKFGQNFLIDKDKTQRIVDLINANEDDLIIEIGPGAGALSKELVKFNSFYRAFEIDEDTKEDWRRRRNTLANLQLLEGRENESKNDTPLAEWLEIPENRDNVKYLPEGISYDLSNFEVFMQKRQELMSKQLKTILV